MRDPFTYIPPNDTTAPKYAAIRAAWDRALTVCLDAVVDDCDPAQRHKVVGEATRALADVIMEQAPPSSDDTSAAYRCVRLARMAANEAITRRTAGDHVDTKNLIRVMTDNLLAARWQACAAIALED